MNWEAILAVVWAFLNSPIGIGLVGLIAAVTIARIIAAVPAWAPLEGTIISAVKFAEATIPDGTGNKSLAKLDRAFQYVLKVYADRNGKLPPDNLQAAIREGIQIVHDRLEEKGTLK